MGAARFEYSTPNLTAIVGLDAALGVFESIEGGMQAIEERVLGLTTYAIAGLERLGYPVISPQGTVNALASSASHRIPTTAI